MRANSSTPPRNKPPRGGYARMPYYRTRTPYYIGCASPKKRADFVTLNDNYRSKPHTLLII